MNAVFLDKDGTLVENVENNAEPGLVEFYPDVWPALHLLQKNGFGLVIATNQPGIGQGYFTEEDILSVSHFIRTAFFEQGLRLDGFYYCPHHPDALDHRYKKNCICRKPAPGLLLTAASELNIDLAASWMIGDILDDIEAGKAAGCRTILLDNGNESQWVYEEKRIPDFISPTLMEAALLIDAQVQKERGAMPWRD
ncbi:MAG: HAD family hydrolase [Candidatus Omnitrophota bacterium]